MSKWRRNFWKHILPPKLWTIDGWDKLYRSHCIKASLQCKRILAKSEKVQFFRQQLVAATWVFRQGVTAGRSISDTDPSIGSGCGGRHYSAIFQRGTMGVVSGWSGRVSPPLCLHLWRGLRWREDHTQTHLHTTPSTRPLRTTDLAGSETDGQTKLCSMWFEEHRLLLLFTSGDQPSLVCERDIPKAEWV